MKFNRRDTIRQLVLGAGAAFSGSLFPHSAFASVSGSAPKRVIFFLQNQGFEPGTCIPDGMKNQWIPRQGQVTRTDRGTRTF